MYKNFFFYIMGLIMGGVIMSLFRFKLDVHETVYVPFPDTHTFGQQEETTHAYETHQAV